MTTTTIREWADLLELDPELRELDAMLARYRAIVNEENRWAIYDRAKDQLRRRVGWEADHAVAELQTAAAYEIGIDHVCKVLGV